MAKWPRVSNHRQDSRKPSTSVREFQCISYYFKPNEIHVTYRQTIPDLRLHRQPKGMTWRIPWASWLVDAVHMACREVHAVSGPSVLVFFSLLLCCTHFVPFRASTLFVFYLIRWTVDAQHKVYRTYNLVARTEGRGRGASVLVSPARHDDVTTNITEEAAESSHEGFSHKRTATRVMASYA